MSKLYSASTRGFYAKDIHGEDIPADAVEISDEEWAGLLAGQADGQTIVPGKDGKPVLIGFTLEQRAQMRRTARNQLLAETDATVNRHRDEVEAGGQTTLTPEAYKALQEWRGQLRAIAEHPDFPDVQFPARPAGV